MRGSSNRGGVQPELQILTILQWTMTKKMLWVICVSSRIYNTYCWSKYTRYWLIFVMRKDKFFMSGVTRSFLAPRTVTELTSPPPAALPPLDSLV